jgi:APA family basic amino acid/polyamine antiporter
MARDGELPGFIARLDPKRGVPRNAILLGGAGMLLLVFLSDLPHIAYISSFSLLLYYAAMNLSGLRVLKGRVRIVTGLGLLSCLVLMTNLPWLSWIVGAGVVAAGAAAFGLFLRGRGKT